MCSISFGTDVRLVYGHCWKHIIMLYKVNIDGIDDN